MTLHHSEETHQLLVDRVPDATGKPMKEWFAVVDEGPAFARFDDRVNWLRDEQRFPVTIDFEAGDLEPSDLRVGSQASVIVYTGDNWIMNSLGKLYIRVNALLSYAY